MADCPLIDEVVIPMRKTSAEIMKSVITEKRPSSTKMKATQPLSKTPVTKITSRISSRSELKRGSAGAKRDKAPYPVSPHMMRIERIATKAIITTRFPRTEIIAPCSLVAWFLLIFVQVAPHFSSDKLLVLH